MKLALLGKLLQQLLQTQFERVLLFGPPHERLQTHFHAGIQIGPEQRLESFQQTVLLPPDEGEEDSRKLPLVHDIQRVERLACLVRQCGVRHARAHPGVQAEGEELAPQDLGRLEKDARRHHLAAQHLLGVLEEVQIMRAGAVGEGGGERVSVAAPGAADPLEIGGLGRGHGAKQHGRQVADVHPHLERGRGREQVFIPGLGLPGLKAQFQRLAVVPL